MLNNQLTMDQMNFTRENINNTLEMVIYNILINLKKDLSNERAGLIVERNV
jgi:hypothetical protein